VKENRNIFLLSTTHERGSVSKESGKSHIVEFYNATKGAVDTFDKMTADMSCSRKTQRWPLCYFYGMINACLVNSYIIYVHNMIKTKEKPLSRRDFAKKVCEDLMAPWLRERLSVPTLQRSLKRKIEDVLGEDGPVAELEVQEGQKRKICAYCPSKKRRMTRFQCYSCKKYMCLEHQAKVCTNCV
jgi:hypothetical protein